MEVHHGRSASLCAMVILATLASTNAEVNGDETVPQGENGQVPGERRERFGLNVSLEGRYDDNIIQLSERDLDRLKANTDPSRFRIETPDDTIAEGRFSFRYKARPIPRRETAFLAFLDAHRYTRNSVKDYQEFGVSILQEITASRQHLGSLRVEFSRTPHFYLRQLTDNDASFAAGRRIREAATYSQNEYSIAYRQELINNRLEGRLSRTRRPRDFDHHFEERDSTTDSWSLSLQGRPFGGSRIEVGLGYEAGALHARGDLSSTPIPDDDISYRYHAIVFEAEVPWGTRRRGHLKFDVEREIRNFTTDNPFDILHSDREDERRDYRARLVQHMAGDLDLVAEVRHRSNNAAFPTDFTTSDEVTDYVENLVSLGLVWHLRF